MNDTTLTTETPAPSTAVIAVREIAASADCAADAVTAFRALVRRMPLATSVVLVGLGYMIGRIAGSVPKMDQ